MKLFMSHSKLDSPAITALKEHLESFGEQVWIDDAELDPGVEWWEAILREIQNCSVFVFALSQNSLDSEPCRKELEYAKALHRPILPVQIGNVDDVRAHEIFTLQYIDYRNPTPATGGQLLLAVQERRSTHTPLPEPLPDPPPIPYEYLLRINAATQGAERISPDNQDAMVRQLREALWDQRNESVREGILRALSALKRRPEATRMTIEDIDQVFERYGEPEPPPEPEPEPPPVNQAPRGWYLDPDGSGRQRWWDGERWTDHYDRPGPQPEPKPPPIPPQAGKPNDYLVWAIVSVFLCWPLGIPAILNANKVSGLWSQGRHDEARRASTNARNFAMWGAVVGALVLIVALIAWGSELSGTTSTSY